MRKFSVSYFSNFHMLNPLGKMYSLSFHPLLLIALGVWLTSCNGEGIIKQEEAIAKYKGHLLYENQLTDHLPRDLDTQDSIRLSRLFIEDWLTARVLEDRATNTIPDLEKKIGPKLEDFKNQLIEYEYMRYVTQRELYKAVSPREVRNYYLQNTDKFVSKASYYSFFYIKTYQPLDADQISSIRSKDSKLLAELTEWCASQSDIEYKLDSTFTTEKELDLVEKGFPLNIKEVPLNQVYSYNDKEGSTDKTTYHLFKLLNKVQVGERKPLEMCREEIKGIILNQRKRKLLDQTKTWLVDQAKLNRDIEIY